MKHQQYGKHTVDTRYKMLQFLLNFLAKLWLRFQRIGGLRWRHSWSSWWKCWSHLQGTLHIQLGQVKMVILNLNWYYQDWNFQHAKLSKSTQWSWWVDFKRGMKSLLPICLIPICLLPDMHSGVNARQLGGKHSVKSVQKSKTPLPSAKRQKLKYQSERSLHQSVGQIDCTDFLVGAVCLTNS